MKVFKRSINKDRRFIEVNRDKAKSAIFKEKNILHKLIEVDNPEYILKLNYNKKFEDEILKEIKNFEHTYYKKLKKKMNEKDEHFNLSINKYNSADNIRRKNSNDSFIIEKRMHCHSVSGKNNKKAIRYA